MLALLEALQDGHRRRPGARPRLGVDVRTSAATSLRCGTSASRSRPSAGRGGSYRLRPSYRVPPLMFTAPEAAAVALGLMAARRLGLESDGALAKVRRVLPDRVRLPVESLEHTLGFTGELDAAPPDGETLLALADAACRSRRIHACYTDSGGVATARELSPYGVVSHPAAGTSPPTTTPATTSAHCAPTASRTSARRPRRARPGASTRSPSSAAPSPASPGPTRSRSSCTPTPPPPPAASHRRSPNSNPPATTPSCACAPTRSTGPPACSPAPAATSPSATRQPSESASALAPAYAA